ncbi:MAG: TraR/DksA family transcriptional regulator [Thermoanaerobaculales bacterium]|jgi:DnaK suppressor protein|nr:TraR/DksA family transcriptional regulator [Thermoanaerobaculales bacterium]
MNKKQMETYRKLLLDKRAELLARVKAARASETEGRREDAPDLGDRALSTMNRDLSYRLTTGERDILKRIDDALDRLESEGYGECQSCGKKVQPGRLTAVPWAQFCIDCQELLDLGEL